MLPDIALAPAEIVIVMFAGPPLRLHWMVMLALESVGATSEGSYANASELRLLTTQVVPGAARANGIAAAESIEIIKNARALLTDQCLFQFNVDFRCVRYAQVYRTSSAGQLNFEPVLSGAKPFHIKFAT